MNVVERGSDDGTGNGNGGTACESILWYTC